MMVRWMLVAALPLAIGAAPAPNSMTQADAIEFMKAVGSDAGTELFFAKAMGETAPAEPVALAKVTAIFVEHGCDMAIRFEPLPGNFVPWRSPMFISWRTMRKVSAYGSYMQFDHPNARGAWGIAVLPKWIARFKVAATQLLTDCGGGKG